MGYHRAGFEIVGIDIDPQLHYPFGFVQADTIRLMHHLINGGVIVTVHEDCCYVLDDFDAIHASPPCQNASRIAKMQRTLRPGKYHHPDLIEQTRECLIKAGKPYVIENVESAKLRNPTKLCGSWFGLDVERHRLFETNFAVWATPCSHGWQQPRFVSLDNRRRRSGLLSPVVGVHGHLHYTGEKELREQAMGIDWMTVEELNQAIPPAYTEFIGRQLMQYLDREGKGH